MISILYIEDSPVNTYIVRKMLKTLGYEMIPAYDGMSGVTLAEQHKPDLILIDLNLPDVHGTAVANHLRRIPELDNVPIVAITATSNETIKHQCIDAGCNDFLEKPVSQAKLIKTIEKHLHVYVPQSG